MLYWFVLLFTINFLLSINYVFIRKGFVFLICTYLPYLLKKDLNNRRKEKNTCYSKAKNWTFYAICCTLVPFFL